MIKKTSNLKPQISKVRIAFVHEYLVKDGGAERVLWEWHKMFPKAPIYTLIYDQIGTHNRFKNCNIKTSFLQKMPLAIKKYHLYFPLMPKAAESLDLSNYDLVLSNSHSYAKGIKVGPKTLHIYYCHTPTRYLWLNPKSHIKKAAYSPFFKIFMPFIIRKIRKWDYAAAQKPPIFIANSQNVAKRISKFYKRESCVIYPPIDVKKFQITNKIKDYYLIVSRLEPHKKVDLAIRAFNKIKKPLIIIGEGTQKPYLQKIAKSNIKFIPWVSDVKLAKYYRQARAFIYPQEEDFGITALEAQSSGRPVIAFAKGGALETIIDGKTGIFFQKQTVQDLIRAIKKSTKIKWRPAQIRRHAQKWDRKIFQKNWKKLIKKCIIKKDKILSKNKLQARGAMRS